MAWDPKKDPRVQSTLDAFAEGTCIAPSGVKADLEAAALDCIKRLEELENDTGNNRTWSHNKEEEKKELYALLQCIEEAASGKVNRTLFEKFCILMHSALLPKNILKNVALFAVSACASLLFSQLVSTGVVSAGVATGAVGLFTAGGTALAGVLGVAALTGPIGIGAILALALAAVALTVACKLFSACLRGLSNFKNWLFGSSKSHRAEAASNEALEEHKRMFKIAPMGSTHPPAAVTVNVNAPSGAKRTPVEVSDQLNNFKSGK